MENHTTGRNQFDENLLMALLQRDDLFNEQNNEAMANYIFTSAEIPAAENSAVRNKLTQAFAKSKWGNWRLNIFILLAGIGIAFVSRLLAPDVPAAASSGTNPTSDNNTTVVTADETEERNPQRNKEMVMPVTDDSVVAETEEPTEEPFVASPGGHTNNYMPPTYTEEDEEVPVLTNAQIKANNKRKLSMFREIAKKKSFTSVPGGPAWREGKRYSVNAFFLQGTEVSNWQYNVFLNDLIADGKSSDYFLAKPVKGNWKAVNIPEFENTYATGAGYEKFPVLNIPRSGAEMYCEWLTREMNEAIDKKDVKWTDAKRPDFRLPSDLEWLRAARGEDSTIQFPWGAKYNALQNARGCYLCNFNYTISKSVLTTEGPEGSKGCVSTKPNTRNVITTAGRAIDTLVLAPEYSYNPAVFGHYLMLGNAAEMVWTYDETLPLKKGAPRAMGGSWYSHADNVRIESKEQFVGVADANVNIGFRVVMTYRTK